MSNFDVGRRQDIQLIDEKLGDSKTSRRGHRLLQRSRNAILRQEKDPKLRSLRSQLLRATQAGDVEAVSKLNEQLHKYDQAHGYDQEEHALSR